MYRCVSKCRKSGVRTRVGVTGSMAASWHYRSAESTGVAAPSHHLGNDMTDQEIFDAFERCFGSINKPIFTFGTVINFARMIEKVIQEKHA